MIRHAMARAAPQRSMTGAQLEQGGFGVSLRRLAAFIGLIALCMPLGLWLYSVGTQTCARDSISHYFYAPFVGSVFVASLTMIGVFLIAYRGDSFAWESGAANVAGALAFGVAVFPTSGHGCASAGAFLARASGMDATGRPIPLSWYKTGRTIVYHLTAGVIAWALLAIGRNFFGEQIRVPTNPDWDVQNRLFFWEATALYAFGIGWILKGRVFGLLPEE